MARVPGYIDVHCHLDLCNDVPAVITRAQAAEVGLILSHGVNPATNRATLGFAVDHPTIVRTALGMYPIDALALDDAAIDAELAFIRRHAADICAIGEVGLDFKEDAAQHERQKEIFRKCIALAQELDKPLIIHSRHAEQECVDILKERGAKKVVMHCFCGKWKLVEQIRDNGWFLTVPTNVTHSQQFQHIAKAMPLTQLFCETDAPFLHPAREQHNEPANVVVSYQTIAQLKGLSVEDVRVGIAQNWMRLFGVE